MTNADQMAMHMNISRVSPVPAAYGKFMKAYLARGAGTGPDICAPVTVNCVGCGAPKSKAKKGINCAYCNRE